MGPRACSFWVLIPISAPKPNCSPSVKRVEALTTTAAASTSEVKRWAAARSPVTMASVWPDAVAGDVVDGPVEVVDDRHAQLQVQELPGEILVGGDAHPHRAHDGHGARRRRPAPRRPGPQRPREGTRSATARWTTRDSAALHTLGRWVLALTTMVERHVQVGGGVDVHVAVAVAVDHVGHRGVLARWPRSATARRGG